MVGRLVQQQHVRLLQQQTRQGDPHLPSAGELTAVAVPVFLRKAQSPQHAADLSLHGVAALVAELLLQLPVAIQQAVMLGPSVGQLFELNPQLMQFLFQAQQLGQC